MLQINDKEFEAMIAQSMDELPQQYIKKLDNVLITYEDEPSPEQRHKLQLRCDQSLFGLYEGIPLTRRGAGYNLVLPDKITIFKNPMLNFVRDIQQLKAQVKHTLWHEIAHYYGLDHDRIHYLENKNFLPKTDII